MIITYIGGGDGDDSDDDDGDDDDDDGDDESAEGAEISSPPPLNGATDSLRPAAMFTIHLCSRALQYFKNHPVRQKE